MYKKVTPIFFILIFISLSFVHAEPPPVDTNLNDEKTLTLFKSEYATLKKVQAQQEREKKEQEAGKLYDRAINLYNQKQLVQAKEAFEKSDILISNFKGSRRYINRIQELIERQLKQEVLEKQKALEEQKRQEILQKQKEIEQKKGEEILQKQRELDQKKNQEKLEKQKELENKKQVNSVQKRNQQPPEQKQPAKAPEQPKRETVATPKQEPPPVLTIEQQAQEARILAELAEKSSRLYRDISDLADDKATNQAKKKLANLQSVLNNLKDEKQRALMGMRVEEQRRFQEQQKEKEQLRLQESAQTYDQALELLRAKNFDEAKQKFLAVENIQPNFKATRTYLTQIDEDRKKVQQQALFELIE